MPDTPPNPIRLGLIQHACVADPAKNVARATELIRDAASQGCGLVVTQELFNTLYFPQAEDAEHFKLAETIPGPTTDHLCALAAELKIDIAASLFEKRAAGIYHNTFIVIDPSGGIANTYRKMHIPDDPGFYEKYYFTPGDLGWQVTPVRGANVGTLVCWDQWFPEAARLTALRGAQILLYPTAIGWIPHDPPDVQHQQRDAWQTVQRSHAITNGIYVAAINRVGQEGDIRFYGSSFVADPSGKVIAQGSATDEQVLIAECDLAMIESQRQAWPFLRDRRIEAYGDLLKRYVDY